MSDAIEYVWVDTLKLNPAVAELRITVVCAPNGDDTSVRVRVTGPRCRFASTVEVAYRPKPGPDFSEDLHTRSFNVLIPEPNLWEPISPFLYHGTAELRRDGKVIAQKDFYHGLRSLQLKPAGMRLNGKLHAVRGVARSLGSDEELIPLRDERVDALLTPAGDTERWGMADELGFLLIGQLASADAPSVTMALSYRDQPSLLGWLFAPGAIEQANASVLGLMRTASRRTHNRQCRFGLELRSVPSEAPPGWISFIALPEDLLPLAEWISLPKLILRRGRSEESNGEAGKAAAPGVLGWINLDG